MLKKLCLAFISIALVQAGAFAANIKIGPKDFSKSINIQLTPGQAFYELELNESVYRNLKRKDLGDFRIVNSAGHSVPTNIRRVATVEQTKTIKRSGLRFYPLSGEPGKTLDDLSVHISKNKDGSIIDIDVRNGNSRKKSTGPVAYLIDAATFKKPITELRLNWSSMDSNGALVSLKVEVSDDLARWNTLNQENVLADLRYQGHRLARGVVHLNDIQSKYIRLSWPKKTEKFSIHSVTAVSLRKTNKVPEYQWSQITGQPDPELANTFLYDIGGHLPVYRARIISQIKNSAIKVTLQSTNQITPSPAQSGKRRHLLDLSNSRRSFLKHDNRRFRPHWRGHLYRQMVYDIDINGSRIKSDDIRLSRVTNRYWRVQIVSNTDVVEQAPILELGWLPDKVLFLATGEPPFQLLVGNEKAGFRGNTDAALIHQMRNKELKPTSATLGEVTSLQEDETDQGGKFGASPIKNWLLWSILVVGIFMLGWMAFRLTKQMSATEKDD